VDTITQDFKRSFSTIIIGEQEWMIDDLKIKEFLNGDPIKRVFSEEEWIRLGSQKKPCYRVKKNTYYYNGFTLMDKRGLVPVDYKIPSVKDWDILRQHLGGNTTMSKTLANYSWKEIIGDSIIEHQGENGNGFNAYPTGCILSSGRLNLGSCTFWWSNRTFESDIPKKLSIFSIGDCSIDVSEINSVDPGFGASLRCIKK